MADEQQVALIKQGRDAWNEWRERNPDHPVDLSHVDLSGARLNKANLAGAKLMGATLRGASLVAVNLTNAHLTRADLSNADLGSADLTEARLTGANLKEARLVGAHLSRAHLTGVTLIRARLTGADLTGVDLWGAELGAANLATADLTHANIMGADLTDANLAGANLTRTNLTGADLTGADLTGAHCWQTVLADLDLSHVVGLDSITHAGPSALDHRTLLRSGVLPLPFLRGCGLPATLIDYLPSLLNAGPIEFYSCFISYSTANQDFADRLHADLQARGVRCWFAPHDMEGGKAIHDQIEQAIRLYDRLLLILSPESMSSRWVKTEIEKAREKEERENRNVLYPIALVPFSDIREWRQFNSDLGDDNARRVREFYVPDFTGWDTDHGRYMAALEKLLASLKSADAQPPIKRNSGPTNNSMDAPDRTR